MSDSAAATAPTDAYDQPGIALGFDMLIGAVFAPFGGIGRLRRRALEVLSGGTVQLNVCRRSSSSN